MRPSAAPIVPSVSGTFGMASHSETTVSRAWPQTIGAAACRTARTGSALVAKAVYIRKAKAVSYRGVQPGGDGGGGRDAA